jgi:hypothetical protein
MPMVEEPSSCSPLAKGRVSSMVCRKIPAPSKLIPSEGIQGMALTQPATSETYQAEQQILAQPSDGKKMPMSRISSNAILDKLWNRLSGPALPTVPCILGPFKVRHALYDWGTSMNSPRWFITAWTRTYWSLPLISCDSQTSL